MNYQPIGPGLHGMMDYGLMTMNMLAPTVLKFDTSAATLSYAFGGMVGGLNASTFFMGNIGYLSVGDLTWYDNALYMTSNMYSKYLIKIQLDNSQTAISSASLANTVGSFSGGLLGLTTVSFPGYANALIGFAGTKAYEICQLDGSQQLYCPAFLGLDAENEIYGAAAARLAMQQTEPTSCVFQSPALGLPETKQPFYSISPNPVNRTGTFRIELSEEPTEPVVIRVIGMQGMEVFTEKKRSTDKALEINLQQTKIASGIYIVEVSGSGFVYHSRLVIE